MLFMLLRIIDHIVIINPLLMNCRDPFGEYLFLLLLELLLLLFSVFFPACKVTVRLLCAKSKQLCQSCSQCVAIRHVELLISDLQKTSFIISRTYVAPLGAIVWFINWIQLCF